MAEQIVGHIDTEQLGDDDYQTTVRWTAPKPEDAEKFIRAFVTRFEKELRDTIADAP